MSLLAPPKLTASVNKLADKPGFEYLIGIVTAKFFLVGVSGFEAFGGKSTSSLKA